VPDYWTTARRYARDNTAFFTPWKAIPSVLATGIQWWLFGFGTLIHVAIVIGTLFGSYVLLWLCEFGWHLLLGAPKVIHTGCLADTAAIREQSRKDIREAAADCKKTLDARDESYAVELQRWAQRNSEMGNALTDCQEQLARKHPADTHRESELQQWLLHVLPSEQSALLWLLHHGPATALEIRNGIGMHLQNEILSAIQKALAKGFLQTDQSPNPDPRRAADTAYRIHDNYREALRNVLHAPR
jgi:hypothetical protein